MATVRRPFGANGCSAASVTDPVSSAASDVRTLVATKWYYYNDDGNVTRVVTNEADASGVPTLTYTATWLEYAVNQKAVVYAIGEQWGAPGYSITDAREFRYDAARERYMDRELAPANPWTGSTVNALSTTWTDYDGDRPYGDFTVSGTPGIVTNMRSHDLGMGSFAWTSGPTPAPDPATVVYDHRDMIGTMRATTDANATWVTSPVYTAFGEQRGGNPTRYGYAGAHGYQTDGTFPYLHVGHRYYDPASGRFLQRDPIGIRGGLNLYAYVHNGPTISVDPAGAEPCPKCGHDPDKSTGDAGNIEVGGKVGINSKGPYGEVSVSGKAKDWRDFLVRSAMVCIAAISGLSPRYADPPPTPPTGPPPPPSIGGGFVVVDPEKGT